MRDTNAVYFWSKGPEEFRFLSNFYPAKIAKGTIEFSSAEHYFQAHKFENSKLFGMVLECKNAWEAKRLADSHNTVVPGWGEKRKDVMYDAIRMKFEQNSLLREMLLATGDFKLVHFAPWGDKFWGVGADYEGENMQGKITMRVREELRR